MRIEEILAHPTKVYLDMDDVTVDWTRGVAEYNNVTVKEVDNAGWDNIYWKNVFENADMKEFYANLDWESNGKSLLGWLLGQYIPVSFLTRPVKEPNTQACIAGKNIWLRRNGLSAIPVIYEFNKEKYALEGNGKPNILIDDHPVNIQKWNAAGCIGIHYKNEWFSTTISKLKKIYGMIDENQP